MLIHRRLEYAFENGYKKTIWKTEGKENKERTEEFETIRAVLGDFTEKKSNLKASKTKKGLRRMLLSCVCIHEAW